MDPIILKIDPFSGMVDINDFVSYCNGSTENLGYSGDSFHSDYLNRLCYIDDFAEGANPLYDDGLSYLKVDFDREFYRDTIDDNKESRENKNKENNKEEYEDENDEEDSLSEDLESEGENDTDDEEELDQDYLDVTEDDDFGNDDYYSEDEALYSDNESDEEEKRKEEEEWVRKYGYNPFIVVDHDGRDYNVVVGEKDDIFSMAKRILMMPGGLVSIPTETVYGLAGNIYFEESLRRIFEIKKRPLNDPLIVHVYSFDYALKHLYDVDEVEGGLIKYLAEKFTPGPLTIVSRCKKSVPKILTNNTGYLGVRCPNNKLCLELLKYIKVPLAAPSANKFGHISPTCPEHVFFEFRGEQLYILDGGPCQIGIESTVVKVYSHKCNEYDKEGEEKDNINGNEDNRNNSKEENKEKEDRICSVEILRKGAVTIEDLRRELREFKNVKVYESVKSVNGVEKVNGDKENNKEDSIGKMHKMESPGILTTHYAPNVPTYMVLVDEMEVNGCNGNKDKENKKEINGDYKKDKDDDKYNSSKVEKGDNKEKKEYKNISCKNVVFIDIGSRFKRYCELFKSYLSIENDPIILANQLYSLLRRAEYLSLAKKKRNLSENENRSRSKGSMESKGNKGGKASKSIILIYFNEENVDLYSSIHDRLMRATSGNVVYVKEIEGGIKIVKK